MSYEKDKALEARLSRVYKIKYDSADYLTGEGSWYTGVDRYFLARSITEALSASDALFPGRDVELVELVFDKVIT